jgi:hypothetical protein
VYKCEGNNLSGEVVLIQPRILFYKLLDTLRITRQKSFRLYKAMDSFAIVDLYLKKINMEDKQLCKLAKYSLCKYYVWFIRIHISYLEFLGEICWDKEYMSRHFKHML